MQDYHAAVVVASTWELQHDLPQCSWISLRAGFSPSSTDMVRYLAITRRWFSWCPHELDSPACLLHQLLYIHDPFVSSWSRSALAAVEDHEAPLRPTVIAPHVLGTELSSFDGWHSKSVAISPWDDRLPVLWWSDVRGHWVAWAKPQRAPSEIELPGALIPMRRVIASLVTIAASCGR